MFKRIRFRIYGALLNWHASKGMTCSKIAEEYMLESQKHAEKAQKYVQKLTLIKVREEGS